MGEHDRGLSPPGLSPPGLSPPGLSLLGLSLLGPAEQVAPRLLGMRLIAGGVTIRLTEVEAYAGEADPGSHAFRGRTPRTEVMFGPAGRAYVYFSYGMHWCLNVVIGEVGTAGAVLLRGAEVQAGRQQARSRRPGAADRDLCRGPARLTKALGIDRRHNGVDLLDPAAAVQLRAADAPLDASRICSGPRVGVSGAGSSTAWRFWLPDEPTVSAYRPAGSRRRPGTRGSTS